MKAVLRHFFQQAHTRLVQMDWNSRVELPRGWRHIGEDACDNLFGLVPSDMPKTVARAFGIRAEMVGNKMSGKVVWWRVIGEY